VKFAKKIDGKYCTQIMVCKYCTQIMVCNAPVSKMTAMLIFEVRQLDAVAPVHAMNAYVGVEV